MYWLTGILGVVLFFAPFIFGYSGNAVALWTSLLIGLATITVSWLEGANDGKEKWEYWTAGVLGILAIAAPFVLGFSSEVTAMWTIVIMGVLIAVFAGGRLTTGHFKST